MLALLVEADAYYAEERAASLAKRSAFWTHDPGNGTGMKDYLRTGEPNESETHREIAELRHEI